MKKMILLASVLSVMAHNAAAVDVQPYVGADYVYSWASVKHDDYFKNRFNAFNLSAGVMTTSTIGVELSYQQSEQGKKASEFGQTKTEYKIYGLDGVYCVSLFDMLQGIASVGGGYYNIKAKVKSDGNFKHDDDNHFGLRFGLGAQYSINENVAIRLMGRYHYLDTHLLHHMTDMTLGARYYF